MVNVMYILFIYLGVDNYEILYIKICKYIVIFVLLKKRKFWDNFVY